MRYRAILATALALAFTAGGALAQTSKKPAGEATLGGSGRSAGGAVLTRDELRNCLVEQDALKTAGAELAREQQAVDADKAEIASAGAALKDKLDKLDRSSEEAVRAHVAEVQAHDKRIEEWNAKLPAYNDRVAVLAKRNDTWKGRCADRRYKEDDLILLQARKQVPAGTK